MSIIAYSIVIALLLIFPEICAESAKEALTVWSLHIIPSLFPYMLFTQMLSRQLQKTKCSPFIACALLGIFGGSPSGAVCISMHQKSFSRKDILVLFALTGIISPMFFLGTIRLFTDDALFSRRLLAAQWIGALLAALAVSLFPMRPINLLHESSAEPPRKDALSHSIDAILHVGGCIICFNVLAGMMRLLPFSETLRSLIHALLEISGGAHAMIRLPLSPAACASLLAFATGFGGFSILFQNLQFLSQTGAGFYMPFLIALIRGIFSAAAMRILIML